MQPMRRAHEIAYLALRTLSSLLDPGLISSGSTDREEMAWMSRRRKTPDPSAGSLRDVMGASPAPASVTVSFAHWTRSASEI